MTEQNTIEAVARLMSDLREASGGTYKLYCVNKQLSLIAKQDPPRLGILIDTFTSFDINEGLTSERWNDLHAKLLTLIAKGVL